MIAVPQVWELIRKSIINKVNSSGGLKKSVFNAAVKAKQAAMNKSIPGVAGLTDTMVFNAVRKQMGGKLITLINGGGPIAATTQGFLSAALVQMVQVRTLCRKFPGLVTMANTIHRGTA
jgi:long-chain acyl-CoA synthetase